MRMPRALLIAGLLLLIGCSSGGEPAAAPESPDSGATAAAEVTEIPTEATSDEATRQATEEAAEEPSEVAADGDVQSAAALLASPPSGYAFRKLPTATQRQFQQQLGKVYDSPFIRDWEARTLQKGRTPLGVVLAVRFSPETSEADMKGFNVGIEKGAGVKGEPVTLGGKDLTFIDSEVTPAYLYSGDDYRLLFLGIRKAPLEAAVADVVQSVE